MSNLDEELRNALRRQEPPPDFADRVLARVASAPPVRPWRLFPSIRWVALAATVVLLAGGLEIERRRRIRAQGEAAKERVMLALRITSGKLRFVKEKINGIDSTRR